MIYTVKTRGDGGDGPTLQIEAPNEEHALLRAEKELDRLGEPPSVFPWEIDPDEDE